METKWWQSVSSDRPDLQRIYELIWQSDISQDKKTIK